MKLYKYIPVPVLDNKLYLSYFTNLKVSYPNELNDPFEGFFSRSDLKKRIGCLSMVPPADDKNSIYMWSFYANALKGICIEYNFIPPKVASLKHDRVSYSDKNGINIFTKYSSWKVEKEYRFILASGDERFLPIKNFGLDVSAIYLGVGLLGGHPVDIKSRNQQMRQLEIYCWLKKNFNSTPVHVCARNRKKFMIISKSLTTEQRLHLT